MSAAFALSVREHAEEVFIHAAEQILAGVAFLVEADVSDEVYQFAEAFLVERGPSVIFWEDTLKGGVVTFDGIHGVVEILADGGQLGALMLEIFPARGARHVEDILSEVFVFVFSVGVFVFFEFLVEFVEGVGDVLMYLRKIRPRTTCLYSAASMLLRNLSAVAQRVFSRSLRSVIGLGGVELQHKGAI